MKVSQKKKLKNKLLQQHKKNNKKKNIVTAVFLFLKHPEQTTHSECVTVCYDGAGDDDDEDDGRAGQEKADIAVDARLTFKFQGPRLLLLICRLGSTCVQT